MIYTKFLTIMILSLLFITYSINIKASHKKFLSAPFFLLVKNLNTNNCDKVIQNLKTLSNVHPFSPYIQQIQLNLIYAYYECDDLLKAKLNIDQFLKNNPMHVNIDYILYMQGLINIALSKNMLQKFFYIDTYDRDPAFVNAAFHSFTKIINNYPNSEYIENANRHIVYLKDKLSKHELSIIKYYNKKKAYIAVILRAEEMLKNFPNAYATRKSLIYMKQAYKQLQLNFQEKIK